MSEREELNALARKLWEKAGLHNPFNPTLGDILKFKELEDKKKAEANHEQE